MNISLNPQKITKTLSIIALALGALHLIACIPHFFYGRGYPFAPLSLDAEQNIPTLFSTLLLTFAALLALKIADTQKGSSRLVTLHWLGIALVFFFLAVDEFTEIHEKVDVLIRSNLNTSGFFHFAWVLPYLIVLILLLAFNIRFIRSLPKKTILLLTLGFTFYISTFAIEMGSGAWVEVNGKNPIYYLFVLAEELLELFGTITVIHAFIDYADRQTEHPATST